MNLKGKKLMLSKLIQRYGSYSAPLLSSVIKLFQMAFNKLFRAIVFLTVLRYQQYIRFLKSRNQLSKKADIFSSRQYQGLLCEIIVILLQPYPFFRGKFLLVFVFTSRFKKEFILRLEVLMAMNSDTS